jgi:hypothetical protein
MEEPVAGFVVNLHVAHPQLSADLHLGVEEVGSRIVVVQARVYHLHLLTVGRLEAVEWEEPVFPAIMQQLFHGLLIIIEMRFKRYRIAIQVKSHCRFL